MTPSTTPPPSFDWKRWPDTETYVDSLIAEALEGNAFASGLAKRMAEETSTRFGDWVDHLVVTDGPGRRGELAGLGYARETELGSPGQTVFTHAGGTFPALVLVGGDGADVREVGIKVESVPAFSRAHDLGLEVQGPPLGPFRVGRVPGERTGFAAVERRAYRGFETFPGSWARAGRMAPQMAREVLAARELWQGRRRRFDDDAEGFTATEVTLARVIERVGPDLACQVVFEVERDYWQARNRAAQVQKGRQDRLGLGWANHDHHTFRSSRAFFPRLIGIFEALGFRLRERFHAGAQAGWGAQVLEHPTTGIVVFADLDLAPDEANQDFAHQALPDLPRPHTVGLWVGLHGESILEAGMHHLEAQFAFDDLRADLKAEANVEMMPPFSDFPFLRQAFTAGERWPVDPRRADRLRERGGITESQHARFLAEGAIGSHLEDLQRHEGYKGFNQQAVSAILAATDPRL